MDREHVINIRTLVDGANDYHLCYDEDKEEFFVWGRDSYNACYTDFIEAKTCFDVCIFMYIFKGVKL